MPRRESTTMTDIQQRINQFKQMAEADPENELGHFSLGKTCLEAGRFDEAIVSLLRTIEINPRMSRAHQFLGEAYEKAGKKSDAIDTYTRGVKVADAQRDRVPRDAMVAALRELGAAVPEIKAAAPGATSGTGGADTGFSCARCGRPDQKLPKQPFKGDIGKKVFDNVCQTCWVEWIGMGTKVINELGLVMANPHSQDVYDQHMIEFLQLDTR